MTKNRTFAAVDLGAESGRVVLGRLSDVRVEIEIVHRFENRPLRLPDGLHWNLPGLFVDTLGGLARAAAAAGALDGVGIDGWGVDYALLDDSFTLLGLPFHYRDERVDDDVLARAHARVPQAELYARTGIHAMPINTVYQLLAERGNACAVAERVAMVPDLLAYWLSGELANEATIASTTGLLEARGSRWAGDIVARLGLPERPFGGEVVEPGFLLGTVLDEHQPLAAAAVGAPVLMVASHDTASAFAAAPVRGADAAILSSGTWSLLGVEVSEPLLGPAASDFNLTNERGVDGTTRLLRNVMGLWLLQECRRDWAAAGSAYDYRQLQELVSGVRPDVPLFDPDHPSLLRGGGLPGRIAALCRQGGQPPPRGHGEIVRSILVSLACKYRLVLDQLRAVTGRNLDIVHVVGGGSRNAVLCQLTADLLELPVLAGPDEATALGNVLMQARATGELASLAEMRALVAQSLTPMTYRPSADQPAPETYERFLAVTRLAAPTPSHAAA